MCHTKIINPSRLRETFGSETGEKTEVKQKQKSRPKVTEMMENMERCCWSDVVVGRVGGWSGVVASTTRMKHCFMCRPSLQDPRRSCRKPHLLPWSAAIGPQPDPNKHHPFFHHKKKKRLKERVVERGEEGARSVQKASAEPRVSAGEEGGRGAEEGKPQEDYERWAPRFSSTSPFWKLLYRLADAFWSNPCSAGASCLTLPSRTPSPASSQS